MTFKHRMTCLAALALLTAAGCRAQRASDPPSADEAREVLIAALDAWKRGETPADLQGRVPAMHVADEDWSQGCKLKAYQILGGQDPRANDLRVKVSLSLRDTRGRAVEKRVAYLVATRPAITIGREFE